MQADGAGLWESIPEGKNKECQGLLDLGILLMIENSPLSGEFQKGEAYSCQKRSSPLLQKSCPDFCSSKGERQWMIKV